MTKYLVILLALTLAACGSSKTDLGNKEQPAQKQTFTFNGQDWHITLPGDWEVLPAERQVPFMAQKGSANLAILERDRTNQDPAEQIINSAEKQFFTFTLNNRSENTWQFTGQPGPTNTPRTFWQEAKTISDTPKFLLASCSEITDNSKNSKCAAIVGSWEMVVVEG